MNFEEIISDIDKLNGLRLNSIKIGAEIKLLSVNRSDKRILLETVNGKKRTRPFSEFQKIWERLQEEIAVHVEKVLDGSGSSRNQPETIFANLPYIEWFKFEGKKHISYVGQNTHPMGTLKQMDEIKAEEVRSKLRKGSGTESATSIIIISDDIFIASEKMEFATGVKVEPIAPGIYRQDKGPTTIFLVTQTVVPSDINPGTYLVINSVSIPKGGIPCKILNNVYYAISGGGLNYMVLIP
jgi:hypothetical protein